MHFEHYGSARTQYIEHQEGCMGMVQKGRVDIHIAHISAQLFIGKSQSFKDKIIMISIQ
jgi:hypothetical protein